MTVRTTVTLDDDVAAAVEQLRVAEGVGPSEAVNRLVRKGLVANKTAGQYQHRTAALGARVDLTNIGEVLDLLDEV